MYHFFAKKKKKPVIIAIHGFGERRVDQLIPLKNYFEEKGYQVDCPVLFDCSNENDTNGEDWIQRAKSCIEAHLNKKEEIVLCGFSMGGVIASSLATQYRISKLILIAPAFNYMTISNVKDAVTKYLENKEEKPRNSNYVPMPASFTTTFREIVDQYKNDIEKVSCPTIIFHGTEDETISYSSSKKVIKKLSKQQSALVLLNDGTHHLLEDEINSKILLETAYAFLLDKIM